MTSARRPMTMLAAGALALVGLPSLAAADVEPGLPAWDRVESPNVGTGRSELNGIDALAPDAVWAVGAGIDDNFHAPLVERFGGGSWSVEKTPELEQEQGGFGADLLQVDAIADDDVWAVGGYNDLGDSLIMHRDGSEWTEITHPTPNTYQRLEDVSAVASDDVWTVGSKSNGGGAPRTHVLHWDGSAWTVIPSPNPTGYDRLLGVEAIAADDVWAVGARGSGTPLTMHWDGAAWTAVAAPGTGELNAVAGVASDDVWAVGAGDLLLHWDGEAWTSFDAPDHAGYGRLFGVTARAADDVWAVGSTSSSTLAMHWDGSAWELVSSPRREAYNDLESVTHTADRVLAAGVGDQSTLVVRWEDIDEPEIESTPNVGIGENSLLGVHAPEPDDVWVVGSAERDTLTEHWDGTEFAVVPSPNQPGRDNTLEDVDGVAPDDVWAVGHHDAVDLIGSRTLAMHWDGEAWEIVPTPSRGRSYIANELRGVAAIASDDVWAIGRRGPDRNRPVVMHWDGREWTLVRSRCDSELSGITAFASDDVWAVGGVTSCHYNGKKWKPVPLGGSGLLDMSDIDGTSSRDLWAVGTEFVECGEGLCQGGAAQHYDGTSWRDVRVDSAPLNGVDAIARDDVWAVGIGGEAVLVHYDGSSWDVVPQPDLPGSPSLMSVEASGPDDLWAAGQSDAPYGASLVVHARAFDAGAVVGDSNVGGATVSWFGPESGSVETEPTGDYQVGGLEVGRYTFVLTFPGCTPGSKIVRVQAGTTVALDLAADCSAGG